jgi:spore coat protein H
MTRPLFFSYAALALGCTTFLACSDDSSEAPDASQLEPDEDGGDGGGRDAGSDGGEDLAELSATVYDPEALLEVELTLAEDDWELVRSEGRSLVETFAGCADPSFAYTEVPASIVIDGEAIDGIGVRKKGLIGSLSALRPSLRVDFAQTDDNARFRGLESITLNNNRQDTEIVRQCLAYHVFTAAGLPAPRCAFAHVTVNGEDLGIYTNVERVGKPLLARYFESDDGDLFEGNAGADFRSDKLGSFEKKTNEDVPGHDALEPLSRALEESDESALAEVEELVDLDAFMRFWAVESLISHWDGYTGNSNNFFVYADPTSGKLSFLPWGTDGSFERDHGFLPEEGRPVSLFAMARLPARLYAWPSSRERYRAVMQDVLDEAWNEEQLEAELDRMAALVEGADPAGLDELRALIRTRRDEVQAELDGDAPAWPFAERDATTCNDDSVEVSGTFDVVWGAIDATLPSEGNTLRAPVEGQGDEFADMLGSAGDTRDSSLGGPSIRLVAPLSDGTVVIAQLSIGQHSLAPGTYPFHGVETAGILVRAQNMTDFVVIGFIGDGEIVFEEASMEDGAPVRGHFTGRMTSVNIF